MILENGAWRGEEILGHGRVRTAREAGSSQHLPGMRVSERAKPASRGLSPVNLSLERRGQEGPRKAWGDIASPQPRHAQLSPSVNLTVPRGYPEISWLRPHQRD